MRKSIFYFSLALILLLSNAFAQGKLSGTVTDGLTNNPLSGANVFIEGTNYGAAADADGNYVISNILDGSYSVTAGYIGYKSASSEVTISGAEASASFALEVDPLRTEEVVVTGAASRTTKATAEISVQRISASELTEKNNYSSVDNILAGRVAGVSLTKASGNAGSQFKMQMRSGGGLNGDGQPVFFIDGVKVENTNWRGGSQDDPPDIGITALASLNPEDIQGIEVIKGPAGASSYGTGGSNGVVLITTKRGKSSSSGSNWKMNYKGTFGYNDQDREYTEQEFRSYKWVNDYFRPGQIAKHSVSVSGGSETMNLYFSVDRPYEEMHTPKNYMDQQNIRANLDFRPNNKINIMASTAFNNAEVQLPGRYRADGVFGVVTYAANPWVMMDPTKEAYFDYQTEMNYINSFVGSVTGELTPFSSGLLGGLSARLTYGLNDRDNRNIYTAQVTDEDITGESDEGEKMVSQRNSQVSTYNWDVKYDYTLGGISGSSVIGSQAFDERSRGFGATRSGFVTDQITTISAGAVSVETYDFMNHFRSAGLFTEHSFSLNQTFFGSFMLRRDYASVLGSTASDISYPRFSGAVRLDRLGIVPKPISFLKLRAAYGETGILPGRTDAIPTLWSAVNSQYGVGAVLTDIGNPEIKPERITEFEVGFETEVANFAFDFTYYQQNAKESIVDRENVGSSGMTQSPGKFNVGEIQGSGWESQIFSYFGGKALGGWKLDLTLTNSYQENEVVSMGGADPIYGGPGGGKQAFAEGYPKHTFYNDINVGALFSDGTNVMENDLHPMYGEVMPAGAYYGDEVSDGKVYLGTGMPDRIGSFSFNLNMFGFDLSGLMNWKSGHVLYNEARVDMIWWAVDMASGDGSDPNDVCGTNVIRYDELAEMLGFGNHCAGKSEITNYSSQEYIDAANEYARTNPFFDANSIQPGDFIKLRELSLSYDVSRFTKSLPVIGSLNNLTLGVSGTNLWAKYHKDFTGVDPEINSMGYHGGPQNMMQAGSLPTPKSVNMFFKFSI